MSLPTYLVGPVQTKAYAILRANVYGVLEHYELTPSHWAMLGVVLEARDGIRQSEIARALNVKPPLITIMVSSLQKKDIIKSVPNPFDTRSKLVIVTPTGKKFIKNIEAELHGTLSELLVGLTEDDLKAYYRVLETIISNQSRSNSQSV
jgi:DNA-binding MarR family transcriptional regulator